MTPRLSQVILWGLVLGIHTRKLSFDVVYCFSSAVFLKWGKTRPGKDELCLYVTKLGLKV